MYRDTDLRRLDRLISQRPDATLEELRALTGKSCSLMAVQRAVVRLGYSLKKTLSASEQNRPDVVQSRREWMQGLMRSDARRLVFIDESGAKTNMTRHRGRGRRGQRVREHAPHGHWHATTMIGSIRLDGTVSCMAIEGSANREVFRAYVNQVLGPTLRRGDVVVVDNLSVYKDAASREIVEALGAHLAFLPPYCPDFNPIEKMWSKAKNHLRSAKARTHPRLIATIGEAFSTITASDAEGYFFARISDISFVKRSKRGR